ncbi:AI-2E family transporter [Paenibacillus sp. 481]|uniref:AI-2E family transporter n=1 Tax=Paenibacillus sp. 481 TaxID=2835869 RepID=UPI001E28C55C|nr:AI-2E family transporter [Paenibacillus sp. 481]UHA74304.1 AI-2E family transporter [Paenibacillus sp. 481]
MERLFKNKLFIYGIYVLLGLIIVYFLFQLKPLLSQVYLFMKTVLAPFFIAMIIAYVLNPVVTLLNERKVPRTMAVLLIYAVFIASITVILMNMIPMLLKQLQELNSQMPNLTVKAEKLVDGLNDSSIMPQSVRSGLNNWIYAFEEKMARGIADFMDNIGATINMLFIAMIVPFLIFYILKDFDVFERTIIAYVPKSHRKHMVMMLKDIDFALGNYIRGQFLVCVIIGVLAYIGYWMIGMPYALLLALFVAIFNIIPYLGPYFGAAPALIVASTISLKMLIFVAIVNTLCQIMEGNIISPQVVGRTLHMHPLVIIFALLVGGELAGVVGLILAVPFFAAMKVVLQHVFTYYIRRKTT